MKSNHTFLLAILLCVLFPTISFAQNTFDVKGKVIDVAGEPLIGVNLTVKNQKLGTISDIDGNFVLKNIKPESSLTVSYIGYVTQEIKLKSDQIIRIQLIEESQNLNEVMVVAYGTQKKVSLTSAISSINGNELLKSPSANLGNSLSGAVSGLSSVQMSGKPGGDAAKIFVRGISSLTDGVSHSRQAKENIFI
jgi:hypothetical protein